MAVRKDGRGRYYVEFQQGGRRILRRCPPSTTKASAEQYEAELRRTIFAETRLGQKPALSLAAAIQLWLEHTKTSHKDQRMPEQNAVQLAPFVAGKYVEQAPQAAQEARSAWEGTLSPATINRRLAVLKAACTHAWRQDWVAANVAGKIRRLREPEGRKVYLMPAQVMKLAKAGPPRYRAVVMLLAYSGMRTGELLKLPRLPRNAKAFPVRDSKTGDGRDVPIAAPLRPYLKFLPLDVSYRTLAGWHWEAREKVGLPHVRLHDLRHTTASLLANAGVDLFVIGEILGHKAAATTKRYAHLMDKTRQAAIRKLSAVR